MASNEEQERKHEEWIVREIRSLVDEGIESGLSLNTTLPYTFTKLAARDLEWHYKKYCKEYGSVKGLSRKKAMHRFLLAYSEASTYGHNNSQYGHGVNVLDFDRLFENCSLYFISIEGGGIVIIRMLSNYT